jgi:hypothetical protein
MKSADKKVSLLPCAIEKTYLERMLRIENEIGDKLVALYSDRIKGTTTLGFSSLRKGVFEIKQISGIYEVVQIRATPSEITPPSASRQASSLYIELVLLLARQGIDPSSIQRTIYERMEWGLETIKPFHQLSTHALQQCLVNHEIHPALFMKDQFDSLRYMMKILQKENAAIENPGMKNFLLMSEPGNDLIWAYAPWQIRELAIHAAAWHIDATYKLLICAKGLFAIVIRAPSGHGLPVCYFVVGKEDVASISLVIRAFSEWVGIHPNAWIHDCQAAIIRSIEDCFPESRDLLCVFHAIRAWDRQLRVKCVNNAASQQAIGILHSIAMAITNPNEAKEAISRILDILRDEKAALEYLKSVWFSRLDKWAFSSRGDFDRTNNLQESHFHLLKGHYLQRKMQWRIDSLAVKLITEVMKNALVNEVINTPLAGQFNSIGVDIHSIPIPCEERAGKMEHLRHLLSEIRSRATEPDADLDLGIAELQEILKKF